MRGVFFDLKSCELLSKRQTESIYIAKNREGDEVFMNIEAFEKREQAV